MFSPFTQINYYQSHPQIYNKPLNIISSSPKHHSFISHTKKHQYIPSKVHATITIYDQLQCTEPIRPSTTKGNHFPTPHSRIYTFICDENKSYACRKEGSSNIKQTIKVDKRKISTQMKPGNGTLTQNQQTNRHKRCDLDVGGNSKNDADFRDFKLFQGL